VCTGKGTWSAAGIRLALGPNTVLVRATDTSGNVGTATLTVDYQDIKNPVVLIGLPTSSPKYVSKSSTVNLGGSASDETGIASVSWSSDRGYSGSCTGTTSWFGDGIPLKDGDNNITVTATDVAGNKGSDSITVTVPDSIAPVVTIIKPTSLGAWVTESGLIDLSGTSDDNIGVEVVSWTNSRGGTGTCIGKGPWSVNAIKLVPGTNILTVSARDLAKNVGSAVLTVTYNDLVMPSVNIEAPTSEDEYTTRTSTLTISGKASDDNGVASVTWSNSRGGGGTAVGAVSWRITGVKLYTGLNLITITATDLAGNESSDTIRVTLEDIVNPVISISSPTDKSDWTTNSLTLDIGGSASDNVSVTAVKWSNDRGGAGDCVGTTSWTAVAIPLVVGKNVVTVTVYDASGRTGTDSLSVICDVRAPECTITSSPKPTKKSPIVFNIAFTETVTGLTVDSIEVTGGVKGTLAGKGASYTLSVTPLADGLVTCKLPDSVVQDNAGNYNKASDTCTVTYDSTAPTVVITPPSGPTRATSLEFAFRFSEPVVGLDMAKVTVSGATKEKLTGSGDTYRLTVSTRGAGSLVTCKLAASVVQDHAGNNSTASETASVTYDGTSPKCTVSGPASPTRLFPVEFVLTFTEPVFGLDADKINVTGGTKGVLVGSAGSYRLPVMPTSEGTVTCSLPEGLVTDEAGNGNAASNVLSVVFDGTPQSCLVSPSDVSSKASPIVFSIVFSKDVTGFSAASVVVTNGIKGKLTGGKSAYSLAVTPTVEGPVACTVPAGVALDAAGNPNTASNTATVVYDKTPPVCTVTAPGAVASGSPILFSIRFSEPVTGFTAAKISVTNGTKGELTADGMNYVLQVIPARKGKVTCQVASGAAKDAAGNPNAASAVAAVTYDESLTGCTVSGPASPVSTAALRFDVRFSKPVTGFRAESVVVTGGRISSLGGGGAEYVLQVEAAADGEVTCRVPAGAATDPDGNDTHESNTFSVVRDTTGPGCVVVAPSSPTKSLLLEFQISFSEWATDLSVDRIDLKGGTKKSLMGSGGSYVLQVVPATFGEITCQVPSGAVTDAAGNASAASNLAAVTFDGKLVTCIVTSSSALVSSAPIIFDVKFSEPVVDFTAASIAVTNGTPVDVSGGDDRYTVSVAPTRDGSVSLRVPTEAVKTSAGDPNIESNTASVTYDSTPPVGRIETGSELTGLNPIDFVVTFSEPVSGLDASGFAVTGGAVAHVLGSGQRYRVGVAPDGDGEIACGLVAGAAKDAAGNPCLESETASTTYDSTLLSVSVEQAASQRDPTLGMPVYFTVRFSRPVTGFGGSSLVLGGTAGAGIAEVAADGDAYSVAVSGMTRAGSVICSVPAGVVADHAGIRNRESESLDNRVDFSFGLSVAITSPTGVAAVRRTGPTVALAGTATDDTGTTRLEWHTDRGHSGVCAGGSIWHAEDVRLEPGDNQIRVIARDSEGKSGVGSLALNREDVEFDGSWFGLCMVSLPIIPDGIDPKPAVGFFADYWLRYLTSEINYARYPHPSTTFDVAEDVRYRGYWAYFEGEPLMCSGAVPDQAENASVVLKAGWNLIGQPFINPYVWDTSVIRVKTGASEPVPLAEAGSICAGYMWGWNADPADLRAGSYYLVADDEMFPEATRVVMPWRAYWIRAFADCALIIPAP